MISLQPHFEIGRSFEKSIGLSLNEPTTVLQLETVHSTPAISQLKPPPSPAITTAFMEPITTEEAAAGLQLLAYAAIERDTELNRYAGPDVYSSSGEESGSQYLIFDTFYSGGSAAIMDMTNFNVTEFESLWNCVSEYVSEHWNVVRGEKYAYKPFDVLFMLLTVMTHGGQRDILAQTFKIKTASFEKIITKFLQILTEPMYEEVVLEWTNQWKMSRLVRNKKTLIRLGLPNTLRMRPFNKRIVLPVIYRKERSILVVSTSYTAMG